MVNSQVAVALRAARIRDCLSTSYLAVGIVISADRSDLAPARMSFDSGWLLWCHKAGPSTTRDKKLRYVIVCT